MSRLPARVCLPQRVARAFRKGAVIGLPVEVTELVDRYDVRVFQSGDDLRLALEACQKRGVLETPDTSF